MSGHPDFGPGDLVVCVDGSPCRYYGTTGPRQGAVYRAVRVFQMTDGITAWVVELDRDNVRHPVTGEVGFRRADNFRRVEPLPASLTTLLESAPVRQSEDA